jgi:putative membrane protein
MMDKPPLVRSTEQPKIETNRDIKEGWQTLSPIAFLHFLVSWFKFLFSNVIYLIPALALSYKSILEHPYIWLPGIAVVLIILALFAFISFKVYRYRLTASNIEIRSGIFNKTHLNLPFSRVQNVKIEQPVYYRLSGHACVQLDTAGSAKNEAKLIALKLDLAQQLKAQIQQHSPNEQGLEEQENSAENADNNNLSSHSVDTQQEVELNRRQLSDLIIHGISSNRIWIFLGGLAPFYNKILDSAEAWLANLGIDFKKLFSLTSHSILEVGLYALSLTMLIMLVLISFSVLGAIISFYGFTLSKQGDKYIRRSGLFTKHEVSMRLSRLQMIIQKQDWLDVVLKRINLKLEQGGAGRKNPSASAANNKIIVPSIKPEECQRLIDDAYPGNILSTLIQQHGFTPISKAFILRNIIFVLLPIWLAFSLFFIINDNWIALAPVTLALILLSMLVILRWKRWGIAKDKNFVYLRKGLFGVDYHCFPTFKLQQTQFKQNLLMRRSQLASVKFVLASGAIEVPMMTEHFAYQFIDQGLYQVESSRKSWM